MRRPLHAFRTFRGEESPSGEPAAVNDFRSKSMVEEYRGLAIVFAVLALALTAYFIRSMLRAPKPAPPPVQSVYIETLPQKDAPAAPR
jgi:hypothetical protein